MRATPRIHCTSSFEAVLRSPGAQPSATTPCSRSAAVERYSESSPSSRQGEVSDRVGPRRRRDPLRRVDFDELRARHPSVDRILVTLLARRLQRMNELLSEAFYENAHRRVLRRLLELGRFDSESGEEAVRITQEQLGAVAGASRATVATVLPANASAARSRCAEG
jgi:hypothetical protein